MVAQAPSPASNVEDAGEGACATKKPRPRRTSRKLTPPLTYLSHFGLKEFPFGLTPDTAYFFPGGGAQGALNTLLVALESGEGLIKIVGEVGSGKTLLCRHLLNRLEKAGWAAAYIPNPHLSPEGLQLALLEELDGKAAKGRALTRALEERLLALAQEGKRAVALIDEAQAAPLETLEALRLITNLETEKRKLLQIVLFGQPELDAKLADPGVRQIRGRIAFHDQITPLAASETPAYLMHRTRHAGAGETLFHPGAARTLHRASRGVPRLLNILAHKALLLAYGEGRAQVLPRHVILAGRDTPGCRLNWFEKVFPR
ncbi:MAG: AAA family ATPase [Betaproteobacteria bacterium]|nr:AAA family ATPase [Betaproteobacteria bacterium]